MRAIHMEMKLINQDEESLQWKERGKERSFVF